MTTPPRFPAWAGFLLCALSAPAAMAATEIRPGILLGDDADRVYVMAPGGGVEALATASGQPLWRSDLADKPLAASKGRLLTQVDASTDGVLDLVILNGADGALVQQSSLPLPDGVRASVDDGLGTRFRLEVRADQAGLKMGWDHSRRVVQGMRRADRPAPKLAAGGVEVDLERARIAELAASEVPQKSRRSPIQGKFLDGLAGRQFISNDGRHVLASEMDQSAGPPRYLWTIYTLDGQRLGETRSRLSYAPFVVSEGILLYVSNPFSYRSDDGAIRSVPRLLNGVDLASGAEAWSYEVRDTAYRGPFPP